MALTKSSETTVYAIASTASNAASIGSLVDVSTYYKGTLRIRVGRGTGTAFTVGPKVRVEVSPETSPSANDWHVYQVFQMPVGASIGSQTVSGTEAAGQTVVTLAAGTNFAAGDYVFFENGTLGNSEWARVVSVSGADLTLEEGLVNAQTGATCRDQAEQWACAVDLVDYKSLRIVVDGAGSGQAVIAEVIGAFNSGL